MFGYSVFLEEFFLCVSNCIKQSTKLYKTSCSICLTEATGNYVVHKRQWGINKVTVKIQWQLLAKPAVLARTIEPASGRERKHDPRPNKENAIVCSVNQVAFRNPHLKVDRIRTKLAQNLYPCQNQRRTVLCTRVYK